MSKIQCGLMFAPPSISGASDDWAAGSLNISFSYTVELPDTGRHGFLLPARRIKSVGQEAFAGFKAMVQELKDHEVDLHSPR